MIMGAVASSRPLFHVENGWMPIDRRLTEEEAQQIWRRAAELQAVAAERAEQRRRAITAGTALALDGLAVADVLDAAVEAGIGEEFVEAAIAEMENEGDLRPRPGSLMARAADKLLDDPLYVLTATRELHGSAESTFEAMQRVFPNSPFHLLLRDTRGAELFVDGVLVFEVALDGSTAFQHHLSEVSVRRLFVTVRAARERPDRSDVTVRAPLGGTGSRVVRSGGVTALFGGTGAIAGAAAAPSAAGLIGATGLLFTSIMGGVAVISGVAFGGLALSGYRALRDRSLVRATDALDGLVQALAVDVRTQGAFTPRVRSDTNTGRIPL
jgi:hypothetical protein